MSAKAYDKKTAAFAGFVIQNIPADLPVSAYTSFRHLLLRQLQYSMRLEIQPNPPGRLHNDKYFPETIFHLLL